MHLFTVFSLFFFSHYFLRHLFPLLPFLGGVGELIQIWRFDSGCLVGSEVSTQMIDGSRSGEGGRWYCRDGIK